MRSKANLSVPSPEDMKEIIAGLSPKEFRLLNDPNFITEDEADVIMALRDDSDPREDISLDQLFRENGQTRRKR